MATPSRTVRRLTLAVLLAAVIPLFAAILIAQSLVNRVSALLTNPRVVQELERSLALYQELAQSKKEGMRFEADAIAGREPLRAAALLNHAPSIEQELAAVFPHYSNLLVLGVTDSDGKIISQQQREKPLDDKTELSLEVRRPLSANDEGPVLFATFTTPKARFDELASAADFVQFYRQIERSRASIEREYLKAFATLIGITMLAAVGVGALLAAGVTKRIRLLADATQAVGAGNLTVRVPVAGNDEITDLARAFNAMLLEVERSRARIEFLQQMGTWQEMARRLAHEIKNPLTPIQLAVQECHRKYPDTDLRFRQLLDTTLEIVEEEVGTLRRLVTEFSSFARLPRAELKEADLTGFLKDQRNHSMILSEEEDKGMTSDDESLARCVDLAWILPDSPLPTEIDKQMLRRVLVNLIRNAAQAVRDQHRASPGKVLVNLHQQDLNWFAIEIEDDGPGIPVDMRESIFDPYFTTKEDGTGLGLAIVKKIVMEHGGSIESGPSQWNGAKMTIRLPRAGSAASLATRDLSPASQSGRRSR